MTFIRPSSSTTLTSPYIYKGSMPSTAQNYIDAAFPNILDKTGDTITGTINLASGAAINMLSGSQISGAITLNGSSLVGVSSGAISFSTATTISLAVSGTPKATINSIGILMAPNTEISWDSAATGGIAIVQGQTLTATTAAPITLSAQNTFGTSSTGGDVNISSGTGTSASGTIHLKPGGTTTISIGSGGNTFSTGNIFQGTNQYFAANNFLGSSTIFLDSGTQLQITGQQLYGSGSTINGPITITSGSVLTINAGATATFNGTTNINGTLGATSGTPFNFSTTSVAIATSGSTTLSAAQYAHPKITLTISGSPTATCTLVFPNADGTWFVDLQGVIGSFSTTHTLNFTSGSSTATPINTGTGWFKGGFATVAIVSVISGIISIG